MWDLAEWLKIAISPEQCGLNHLLILKFMDDKMGEQSATGKNVAFFDHYLDARVANRIASNVDFQKWLGKRLIEISSGDGNNTILFCQLEI